MTNVECPRCNQESITLKQKLLTNKWVDATCSNCGARLCAQPVVLGLLSCVLTWNIIFFGFLAVTETSWTFAALFVVGWVLIEYFMYYIPLCALKPKGKAQPPSSD